MDATDFLDLASSPIYVFNLEIVAGWSCFKESRIKRVVLKILRLRGFVTVARRPRLTGQLAVQNGRTWRVRK